MNGDQGSDYLRRVSLFLLFRGGNCSGRFLIGLQDEQDFGKPLVCLDRGHDPQWECPGQRASAATRF